MKRAWLLLFGAIACEVTGTTALKLSEVFTALGPSIVVVVAYIASFALLTYALADLPLGLAYGVWCGVGTVLTAAIGVIVFGDPFTLLTGIGLLLVVAGIALMGQGDEEANKAAAPSVV